MPRENILSVRTVARTLFLATILLVAEGLSAQNAYLNLFYKLGSNEYTTGHYSSSMEGVEEIDDIYVLNVQDQIVAELFVSHHQYAKLAINALMYPLYGLTNSYYDIRSGSGSFQTNRGLVIASMDWGAMVISRAVLGADDSIRTSIYERVLDEFRQMLVQAKSEVTASRSLKTLVDRYSKLTGADSVLSGALAKLLVDLEPKVQESAP